MTNTTIASATANSSILSKVFSHDDDISFCLNHADNFATGADYDPELDGMWDYIRGEDVCDCCVEKYLIEHDLCRGCVGVLGAIANLLNISTKDGAAKELDLPRASELFIKLVNEILAEREVKQ
jgi:hypothetical protein